MTRAAAIVSVVALAAGVAACGDRPLTAEALARSQQALTGIAAETVLFLEQWDRGELSEAYARVHRDKLAEQYREVLADLDQPSAGPLAATAQRTRLQAGALGEQLVRLNGSFGRGESGAAPRAAITSIQRELEALRTES